MLTTMSTPTLFAIRCSEKRGGTGHDEILKKSFHTRMGKGVVPRPEFGTQMGR